jgi:MFS family permease
MTPLPAGDRRAAFRLLSACLLVVGFGNAMLLALLPPLAREIGIPDAMVGWIFSLSAVIWVFASPAWGRESDRKGRKPIITMGLTAYMVSMLGFGAFALLGQMKVLPQWGVPVGLAWGLIFAGMVMTRAIFGLFGSASSPAAQAYIADRTSASERTEEFAALSAAFALGNAVGPGFCALLASEVGLVAPIFLTAALAAVAAWAIRKYLPEAPVQPQTERPTVTAADGWRLMRDPRVSAYLLFGFGMSVLAGVLAQTFGFYVMDRLGVSGEHASELTGVGFMMGALALLATQLGILPRLKLGSRMLMLTGSVLIAAGLAMQLWAPSFGALVTSQFVQGVGFGLARPGFTGGSSLAVTQEEQGALAGLVVATNGSGFIFAPIFGGWLYSAVDHTAPLWLALCVSAAMGLFVFRSRRLRQQEAIISSTPSPGQE